LKLLNLVWVPSDCRRVCDIWFATSVSYTKTATTETNNMRATQGHCRQQYVAGHGVTTSVVMKCFTLWHIALLKFDCPFGGNCRLRNIDCQRTTRRCITKHRILRISTQVAVDLYSVSVFVAINKMTFKPVLWNVYHVDYKESHMKHLHMFPVTRRIG
jgi:hypothetical protein